MYENIFFIAEEWNIQFVVRMFLIFSTQGMETCFSTICNGKLWLIAFGSKVGNNKNALDANKKNEQVIYFLGWIYHSKYNSTFIRTLALK